MRNPTNKNLICKSLTMINFSVYNKIEIPKVKVSSSKKYTMEFWFNLYTYGFQNSLQNYNVPFKSQEFIWDLHMRIRIENINNEIFAGCYPIFDNDDSNVYEQLKKMEKISNPISNWIKINCSTNQKESLYSLNNKEYKLDIGTLNIPDLSTIKETELIIKPGDEVNPSKNKYGFFFVKELKLWSYYNPGLFDNSCMYLLYFIYKFF